MESQLTCPQCHIPISATDYFCHQCGQKIKEAPLIFSSGKIIGIYLISFLIPLAGFYYWFKYAQQDDTKVKSVAKVAVAITIVSIIVTVVSIVISVKLAQDILNSVVPGIPTDLQNLGY